MVKIYFELNGKPQYVEIEPGESLLSLLRRLGMKSVRRDAEAENAAPAPCFLRESPCAPASFLPRKSRENRSLP